MRAIHLLRKLDPSEWGGTETAIQRLFDGLRQHGVTPVVYCPRLENATGPDPLLSSGHEVQRFKAFVPIIGISPQRRRQMMAVGGNLMSFNLVSSLWRERDIAVLHSHALGRIGGIARTIARQRRVPLVVSIHGGLLALPPEVKRSFNAPVGGWEWGKFFGLLFQTHRLFRDADAVLTCNPREAALLRERWPDKRILVQPHGVPYELYQRDCRAAATEAFPAIQGRHVLLCVGRVDPIKNQDWLLEQAPLIFKKHPDALLVMAGPCTDAPYGELVAQRIAKLGLQTQVLLTGGMASDDPRLIGLLQQAQVLLVPSRSETFGLVILEAWAAGAAPISSRASGPAALVQHEQNGWLFDLDQPAAFHQALDQALAKPELTRQMAARGAELVRREYSVGSLAERMKQLYEQLIEEKQCVT